MGTGKRYIGKNLWRHISPATFYALKVADNTKDYIQGNEFGSLSPSLGMTQIKYDDDISDPELKKRYSEVDVNRFNLDHDPRKQADATLERLHYNR